MRFLCPTRLSRFAGALFAFSALAASLTALDSSRQQLKSADTAFHAGYAAEKNGDLVTAKQEFEKVVRLVPDIAEGHTALGSILVRLDLPQQAIRELERSLVLKPDDRTTQINLAMAYEQSGNHEKSLEWFRFLERSSAMPLPPSGAIFYIRALAATGNTELALQKAQDAVTANREIAGLHDMLGTLQAQRQDWNSAVIQFNEALHIDPKFAEAYLHRGVALMVQQRTAESVKSLTTAAQLSPQSAFTQIELGKALIANGENAEAVPILLRALALDSSSRDAKYHLGLALQGSAQEQQAIAILQEVIAADPHNAPALTNLGLSLVQTGKSKDAIPLYERALAETPNDALVHQGLGVAYLQEGNLDDAVSEFRTGLKLSPEAYELHYDLGLALKLKDDMAGATSELEQAARLNPSSPDPPYTLGILRMQMGQFDDAVDNFKAALRLRPENGDGWAVLGSVFKQQNKLADATDALQKAIELMPAQPGPHTTLARVLGQQGRTAEAAAERKKASELTQVAVNRQRATFETNTGNIWLQKGAILDAIAHYREAINSDPNHMEAHRQLAVALERQGRSAEANEELQKADQLEKHATPGTSSAR